MKRNWIREQWYTYRMILPKNASQVQLDETRKAFYAGAGALFNIVTNLSAGPEPQEVDLEKMSDIHRELNPYKIEREWKYKGLSCAVVQNREAQSRCGYVRVPPGHPAYGKDYNDVDVNVHGGLTFAALEPCTEHADGQGWWLGFDCAHSGDDMCDPDADMESLSADAKRLIEIHRSFGPRGGEHFWTEPEVAAECERLAEQLAEMTRSRETQSWEQA